MEHANNHKSPTHPSLFDRPTWRRLASRARSNSSNSSNPSPGPRDVVVADRHPLPSRDGQFVRRVMNGPATVRACVTFFRELDEGGEK